MGDYITTYSGIHFYPTKPDMKDIDINDIAHALPLICRGNGHVKQFFSVGQHCIFCALEAKKRAYSKRIVLACLLHDASEAYMSDVPRPFKRYLEDYIEFEEKLLSCIYTKFLGSDLTEEECLIVKAIDNDLLAHDLYYLLNEGEEGKLPDLKRKIDYVTADFETVERQYKEIFFENLTNLHIDR